MDYSVILAAHSGWRFIVLVVFVAAIVRMIYGWISNGQWGVWDNRLGVAVSVVVGIQALLGVIVWIAGQHWAGYSTLAAWEHPITMLIAVAVAHITTSRIKKQTTDQEKFRTATIGFAIAALIVVLGIARITRVV